jgi:hypothetical protein
MNTSNIVKDEEAHRIRRDVCRWMWSYLFLLFRDCDNNYSHIYRQLAVDVTGD